MKLKLSPSAQQDLQEIYSYTQDKWGSKKADNYVANLWDKLQKILQAPQEYRFRHDLYANCQLAVHEKHVILFRVAGQTIEIARILHSAMDAKKHL